jgi:hypothetical protein
MFKIRRTCRAVGFAKADFADFGVRPKRWWGEAPARPQGRRREIRVCHDHLSLGLRKRRAVVYHVPPH